MTTTSPHSSERTKFEGYCFSIVICRHPVTGKYLAVEETKDRGWWIPGGAVDSGETFGIAAIRECKEEAGVEIKLKGIIKIERHLYHTNREDGKQHHRLRVIFYAEPRFIDNCEPKQVADTESLKAEWVTLDEFQQKPKIRGNELVIFGNYLEKKGIEKGVFPLGMFEETFDSGRRYF